MCIYCGTVEKFYCALLYVLMFSINYNILFHVSIKQSHKGEHSIEEHKERIVETCILVTVETHYPYIYIYTLYDFICFIRVTIGL